MARSRTIVVSGVASGIGAAAASLLRESGETVVGIDIRGPAAETVDTPILDDFLNVFAEESATRMQAIGTCSPVEIARIAVLLLDPAYEWINGATIPAERGAITYAGMSKLGLTGLV